MMLRKTFFGVLIIAVFLASGVTARGATIYSPPIPARIGGTVTINGVLLTQGTDSGYTIELTRPNGSKYNPAAQDTDGLNGSGFYTINIPIFDAVKYPGGAHPGDSARIHVFKDGTELLIISPSNGLLTVGDGGSAISVPLQVQTSQISVDPPVGPSIIQRQTIEDITSAPVNLGSVSTGGNSMGLAINFPAYAGPVDIWVGVQLPDKTFIYLDSAHNLTLELVPFEVGVTQASVATIVEEFQICSRFSGANVPEGSWAVFWLVAPANGGRIDLIDFDKGPYKLGFYGFDLRCN